MDALLDDLRQALRTLARRPVFTALAVSVLALGIGANAAVFSVVSTVLLDELPFPDPERLAVVWEAKESRPENVVSPFNFLAWQERSRSFAHLAAFGFRSFEATVEGGDPESVEVQMVTPSYFPVLAVPPLAGRVFSEEEGETGAEPVVVASRAWAESRFGGAEAALGRRIDVAGRTHRVIGVMPAGFTLELTAPGLGFFGGDPHLWAPIRFPPEARQPRGRSLLVVGRLAPGVGLETARAELEALAGALRAEAPEFNDGWTARVEPLHEQVVEEVRPALLVLFGAVSLLLLVACANVANLLLARATARRRELAVRTALGAGRLRLGGQLLLESLLLAGAGAAAGLLLAVWGTELLIARVPGDLALPRAAEVAVDGPVVLFAAGLALATGLLFGTLPAWLAGRVEPRQTLQEESRAGSGGGQGTRRALVAAEVALALVLLAGAGLLLRSFEALSSVDPGFDERGVATASLLLSPARHEGPAAWGAYLDEMLAEVAARPGVEAVGTIQFLPVAGIDAATSFWRSDRPRPEPEEEPVTGVRMIAGDYLEAMGVPLLAGRRFDTRDTAGSPPVALVSDTLARRLYPGEDPVGKRLGYSWGEELEVEIVGVVGSVRHGGLVDEPRPELYRPWRQTPMPLFSVVARGADGDAGAAAAALTGVLPGLDPGAAPPEVVPLAAVMAEATAETRYQLTLLSALAALALLLAVVGVYGVTALLVASRTREIGIRMALGAAPRRVLLRVIAQGMAPVLLGTAAGLAGAWLSGSVLAELLYEVQPGDPATLTGVALLLTATALGACILPARRAARLDPAASLRRE